MRQNHSGTVECHVNGIKSVKRQRNQIANFEMLRIWRFDQTGYTIPKCDEEPTRLDFAPYELKNENPKNASNAVIRFFT